MPRNEATDLDVHLRMKLGSKPITNNICCIHGLQIFEKSKDIKGLGSSLTLASSLVVVFEQLGVYKELISIVKPFDALHLKKEDLDPIGAFRPPPNMNLER